MRRLPLVVLGESALVIGLGSVWLFSEPGRSDDPASLSPVEAAERDAPIVADTVHGPQATERRPEAERDEVRPEWSPAGIGVVVRGRLLERGGGPGPKDASVTFRRPRGYRMGTTVEDQYAVAGLAPGDWTVNVRADGFAVYRVEHTLGPEAVQTLDIELQPSHRVKVFLRTPRGAPLKETREIRLRSLTVVATAAPLEGDLPATDSSSVGDLGLGRYRFFWGGPESQPKEKGQHGELQLDRPPPVNAALLYRHLVLAQKQILPGQEKLSFTVDPEAVRARHCTVTLRLVDGASRRPITEGATVRFATSQGGGVHGKPDAEGKVEVQGVMPGLASVEIQGKDREMLWTLVRVPAGGTLDLGDIVLHRAIKLPGLLIGPDGKPVSGTVQWTDLGTMTFPRELIDRRSTSANGDGEFQLWNAGPRRYVLIARSGEGLMGTGVIDARTRIPPPVEIRLSGRARIVVTATGDPLAGYTVTVRDGQGVPVAAKRIEARWRQATLYVPVGKYTLEVHGNDDRLVKKVPIEAGSSIVQVRVP